MTELFGLTLDGDIDPTTIATAALIIVELVDADGTPYLRLVSSNLPVWQRLGMLHCIIATDTAEAANSFVADEADDA